MRGGSGTGRRYLFLRSGATVIATGGEYDADLQVGYRTVEFALPHGQGTVELHVDTQVAGLLIAALAGEDTPHPVTTRLFTVKGVGSPGDLVIEVPADISAPGDVATYLAVRLTALTRPLIDAELYVDWAVSLGDDYPGAPEPFASLSIDGHKSVQYPLIEAPRGGAQ
jgi:hypothetical protein